MGKMKRNVNMYRDSHLSDSEDSDCPSKKKLSRSYSSSNLLLLLDEKSQEEFKRDLDINNLISDLINKTTISRRRNFSYENGEIPKYPSFEDLSKASTQQSSSIDFPVEIEGKISSSQFTDNTLSENPLEDSVELVKNCSSENYDGIEF